MERSRRPMGPGEVLAAAQRAVRSLSLATVYRTLQAMREDGEVASVELPGEPARYELRKVADTHHHHFRCDRCARVYDLAGCPPGINRLLPKGFRMRGHDLTIYGTCAGCRDPGPSVVPLKQSGSNNRMSAGFAARSYPSKP